MRSKANLKIYDMKILNIMNSIHDNNVNNIAEVNLLHEILNTSKHTKYISSHYPRYPIRIYEYT